MLCPIGKYCNGGYLTGDCAPGYYCISGASAYTPDAPPPSNCSAFAHCAGRCPAGYYCTGGTVSPVPCPAHTLNTLEGSSNESACLPCPAGFYCTQGNPYPEPCPAGYYCPNVGNVIDPQPCPVWTYLDERGSANKSACKPCPAGYWCNETGMDSYAYYTCPAAHYCEAGTSPQRCSSGRSRNTTGARADAECMPCPAGYFCPNDTDNLVGIPCRANYSCPTGSSLETLCPLGYYCPDMTGIPNDCPAGYFCTWGTATYELCTYPYYCPQATNTTRFCPFGYGAVSNTNLRTSIADSCKSCLPGYYGDGKDCIICPAGFYCPAGTGSGDSNICPAGSYCPSGSSEPSPCPTGTYSASQGLTAVTDCQACPANTFTRTAGQVACKPCGSSATSNSGSSTCQCTGKYRAFQPFDGSCICLSGYVYYNEANQLDSNSNSNLDCQPAVDVRCTSSQVRLANRSCVDPTTYSCSAACGSSGGSLSADLGSCKCNAYTSAKELCDTACLATQPKLAIQVATDGSVTMVVTNVTTGIKTSLAVAGAIGPAVTPAGTSNSVVLEMSPDGTYGKILTQGTDVSSLNTPLNTLYSSTPTSGRRRRAAASVSSDPSADAIRNPVVCLNAGDLMVFRLYINNADRAASHYPVYAKDDLHNTNPTFDYGSFRQLQFYIQSTNVSVSTFFFVFADSGTYVFADSQDYSREVIIVVHGNGSACDTSQSRIQASSPDVLTANAIIKTTVQNEAPDTSVIIGVLVFLAVIVLALFVSVIVWRPQNAGINPMAKWVPKYRNLGQPRGARSYLAYMADMKPSPSENEAAEGTQPPNGDKAERGLADAIGWVTNTADQLLEDFSVRVLYDKLEDQNLHLAAQLARHGDDMRAFYDKMSEQNEQLRSLLLSVDPAELVLSLDDQATAAAAASAGAVGGPVPGDSSSARHATVQLISNVQRVRAGGAMSREAELIEALRGLLSKLNSGQISISPEAVRSALANASLPGAAIHASDGSTVPAVELASVQFSSAAEPGQPAAGSGEALRQINAQRMQLERELQVAEEQALTGEVQALAKQREALAKQLSESLAEQLQGDITKSEAKRIIAAHQVELNRALGTFDANRQRQLADLESRLVSRRLKQQAQLTLRLQATAMAAGVPPPQPDDSDVAAALLHQRALEISTAAHEELRSATGDHAAVGARMAEEQSRRLEEAFASQLDNVERLAPELGVTARDDVVQRLAAAIAAIHSAATSKLQAETRYVQEQFALRRQQVTEELADRHMQDKAQLSQQLLTSGRADELDEKLASLDELHRLETADAQASVDATESAFIQQLGSAQSEETVRGVKTVQRNLLEELAKTAGLSEAQCMEILEQQRKLVEALDAELGYERGRQLAELDAKLESRRARLLEEARRRSEEAAARHLLETQRRQMEAVQVAAAAAASLPEAQDATFRPPEVAVAASLEEQALLREQERSKEEMLRQQEDEQARLRQALDAEARQQELEAKQRLEQELELALRERRSRQQAEIAARPDLTPEQLAALLAAHERELDLIRERVEKEHGRQQAALRDKLAARRRRRMDEMKRKQELAVAKEWLAQKRELDDVKRQQAEEVERKAIAVGIRENGADDSDKVIKSVLSRRHASELRGLEAEFAALRRCMVDEAVCQLADACSKKRDKLAKKHEEQLAALQTSNLSPDEALQRRAELVEQQQAEMAALDREQAEEQRKLEKRALAEWDVKFARAKLELKEKHYKEFAAALREFAPNHTTALSLGEAAAQLSDVKAKLEQQRLQEEERLRKEQADFEMKEKARVEAELAAYEQKLAQEMETEKERHKKAQEALSRRKEEVIAKNKEEMERLSKQGLDQDEQKRLMDEHDKDLQKLINKMDAEKLRNESSLQERLEKRRKEKLVRKQQEAVLEAEQRKREFEAQQRAEAERVKADEVLTIKEALNVEAIDELKVQGLAAVPQADTPAAQAAAASAATAAALSSPTVAAAPAGGMPLSYNMAAPLNELELVTLLMASPMYHKLELIRKTLASGSVRLNKKGGSGAGEGYLDPMDGPWSKDTELVPTDLNKLSPRAFVVYKFGCFVVDMVGARCQHPPVTLLLAEKVPANRKFALNAYRNAFHYDATNSILYVRQEKLSSIGEFVMVLVHCLAHIKAGDLRDDSSAEFTREFHHALTALCDDLFFARYKWSSTTAAALKERGAVTSDLDAAARAVLHELFGSRVDEAAKTELIDDLLEVTVRHDTDPRGVHFNKDRLMERLAKYGNLSLSSQLEQFLSDLEGKVDSAAAAGSYKEVGRQLADMTGVTFLTRRIVSPTTLYANLSGTALLNTFANNVGSITDKSTATSLFSSTTADKHGDVLDALNVDFCDVSVLMEDLKESIKSVTAEIDRRLTEESSIGQGNSQRPKVEVEVAALRQQLTELRHKLSQAQLRQAAIADDVKKLKAPAVV